MLECKEAARCELRICRWAACVNYENGDYGPPRWWNPLSKLRHLLAMDACDTVYIGKVATCVAQAFNPFIP